MSIYELYQTWTDDEKKQALAAMTPTRRAELLAALRSAGFTASALRSAGFTASALLSAGFTASEVLSAGNPELTAKTDIQEKAKKMGVAESRFVVDQLKRGLLEGQSYGTVQSCGCFLGTAAKKAGMGVTEFCQKIGIEKSSSSPAEQWFLDVRIGDTPENSHAAKMGVEWIEEVLAVDTPQ